MKDYYQILRVRDDATADEIKTSYRRLTLRLHPDRNERDDAMDKFLEVQQAYEVLSDPVRKRQYDLKRSIEANMPGLLEELQRDLSVKSIRMVISKQRVKVGEPFSVNLRCPVKADYIKLQGLKHFEILQSVEHELWVGDSSVTEAHFVLRAIEEGYFDIGPARAGSTDQEFWSASYPIQVEGIYQKPPATFMERIQPVLLWVLVIALPAFVLYNVANYGVRAPEEIQPLLAPMEPVVNRLPHGANPFPNQVDNQVMQSDTAFGQIIVNNQRNKDAVFLMVDNQHYKVLRAHYVRAGSQLVINGIVPGDCSFFAFSGEDWVPERWLGQYHLVGSFRFNQHFDEIVDGGFKFHFEQKEVGGQMFHALYHLKLLPVNTGKPYELISDTAFFDL